MALASVSCVFKAFIGEGGFAVVQSFKAAKAGVVDNIKGVDRRNLK